MKQIGTKTSHRIASVSLALVAGLLLAGLSAQAQTVYRIVGPDGRVTFSDKPPVTTDKAQDKVTATDRTGRTLEAGGNSLPFELRQVATKYPVTIYTKPNCAPCATGRNVLVARGVPFNERTVTTNEDVEALARISGEQALPFLTIGGQKIKGYSEVEWTQFLDAAGYPTTSKLPGNYRNPAAAPLVAIQRPSEAAVAAATAAAAAPKPDSGQTASAAPADAPPPPNPAGIRF
jgi:glutaredoxin